jgi:hypothetical protein
MKSVITAIIVIVISVLIIALLIWSIQPLTPFGYSLTYSEWLGIVTAISILKTETNQK